jgi:hypothetical protein
VSEFLVEAYVSRESSPGQVPAPEEVSGAAAQLTVEGRPIRLLQSVFVPEDETCFYLFQAKSYEEVVEVAARCGLRFERLVEAHSEWTASARAGV